MALSGMDLTGRRFGRLTVIEFAHHTKSPTGRVNRIWRSRCDCGGSALSQQESLLRGHARSCGCLQRDTVTARNTRHGSAHRGRKTVEYLAWVSAKSRCYNPAYEHFADYGGRGITMCEEWRASFDRFLRDMGTRPPGFSLDRINVDGNYEPGNCRWASIPMQRHNIRTNVRLTVGGVDMTASEAARLFDVDIHVVINRVRAGMSGDELAALVPAIRRRGASRRRQRPNG